MINKKLLTQKDFLLVSDVGTSVNFHLPLSMGAKDTNILVLKKFLGLPDSNALFDADTKSHLMRWQRQNVDTISKIAGWSPLDNSSLDTPAEFDFELGSLGPATFSAMSVAGLSPLTSDFFYSDPHTVVTLPSVTLPEGGITLADCVDPVLRELESVTPEAILEPDNILESLRPSEVVNEPFKDPDYYYVVTSIGVTRSQLGGTSIESYLKNNGTDILARGVREMFKYYNKETQWEVDLSTDAGKAFLPIIKYQKRPLENTRCVLTVDDLNILETVGADESGKSINVLFGQSTAEGDQPIFAAVKKIYIPETRASSTFKALVRVRTEMFDLIPRAPITSTTAFTELVDIDEEIAPVLEEVALRLKSLGLDVSNYDEDALIQKSRDALAVKKFLKKYERELSMLRQQYDLGIKSASELVDLESAKEAADFAKKRMDFEPFPVTIPYKISDIEQDVKAAIKLMKSYDKQVKSFSETGIKIKPENLSLNKEADRLSRLLGKLKKLAKDNDFIISKENSGTLLISYEPTIRPGEGIGGFAGAKIKKIALVSLNDVPGVLTSGFESFLNSSPITNSTTVSYLMQLPLLKKQRNVQSNNTSISQSPSSYGNASAFLLKHHHPTPKIDFNLADVDVRQVLNSPINLVSKSLNVDLDPGFLNAKNTLYKNAIEGAYSVTDKLNYDMDFSDLGELFAEFFDRYDFWALFIDYLKILPDVNAEEVLSEWDFDFKIPEIPKLPTFDPIKLIVKNLEVAISDILTSLLSGLIRDILKTLSKNAPDLLGGAVGDIKINDLINGKLSKDLMPSISNSQVYGGTGPSEVARITTVAIKSFERVGVPTNMLANIANIFESISLALTPNEISSLLTGNADKDTLGIILTVIKSDCSDLKNYVQDTGVVQEIFETVGDFVSDDLLNKISQNPDIVLGDVRCPDDIGAGDILLRETLESANASEDEISRALADASARREAMRGLLKKNPMDALVAELGPQSLPNPYMNENSLKLAGLASKGVFGNIEMVFDNDLSGYVPTFYEASQRPLNPDDPEYDHVGMAQHEFVRRQVEEPNPADDHFTKIKKPGLITIDDNGRVTNVEPAPDLVFNLADKIDSDLFEKIMLIPSKNIRQEASIFPSFRNYLLEPKNNFVGITSGPYPKFTGIEFTGLLELAFDLAGTYDLEKQGPQLQYRINSTTKFPQDNLEQFTDSVVDNRVKDQFNCQIVDQFFVHTPEDCFQVDRPARVFESELRQMQTFNYHEEMSEQLRDLRLSAPDMQNTDTKKLLRPEAFAQFVRNSLEKSVEESKINRLYFRDLAENRYFTEPMLKNWNTDSILWKAISYGDTDESSYELSHFTMLSQNFMDKIAESVSTSRYFNVGQISELSTRISEKYFEDVRSDKVCLIKNKDRPIDFEKIRQQAMEDYKDSLSREENNPINRDFSKPGPLEESFSDQLVFLYIRTFVIEFILKGIFLFSRFRPSQILGQDFIVQYLYDYMETTLERDFQNSQQYKINFYDRVKKIANQSDNKDALVSVIAKLMQDVQQEVITMAEDLFEPEFSSYKEEFFSQLIDQYESSKSVLSRSQIFGDSRPNSLYLDYSSYPTLGRQNPHGQFRVEQYFYVKPPQNDPNYLAKAIDALYYALATANGQRDSSENRYRLYAKRQDGQRDNRLVNPDLHFALSRRMTLGEYEQLLEVLNTPVAPDFINNESGTSFQNALHYVLENTVVGLRLIYIPGYETFQLTAPVFTNFDEYQGDIGIFGSTSSKEVVIGEGGGSIPINLSNYSQYLSSMKLGPVRVDQFEHFVFELAKVENLVDCMGNFAIYTNSRIQPRETAENVFNSYEDTLINSLLGLKDGKIISEDYNSDVKMLFEEIFPLNRMAALYFINEENFFDSKRGFRDFLGGTRGSIRSMYRILQNKKSIGSGDEGLISGDEYPAVMKGNQGASGPFGNVAEALLGDLVPQIAKMVVMAPIIAIKGQAALVDPAFAQMKKIYDRDPCKLRDGLSWGSIKSPPYLSSNSSRSFTSGYLNTDDNTVAPLTLAAPVDISLSVLQIISGIFPPNAGKVRRGVASLLKSVNHTVNSVSQRSGNAYGPFLGPVGFLALSLPHLPGEEPGRRQKQANCTVEGANPAGLPVEICEEEE